MVRFSSLLASCACWFAAFLPLGAMAQVTEVALAGLSYAGDAASLEQRFPYSREYEKAQETAGTRAFTRIETALGRKTSRQLQFTPAQLDELKGREQALVTSLMVNSETVSIERFGDLHKLLVLIRGQAIFFDFKTMTVTRSYPLSFAYIDVFDRDPTPAEVLVRVQKVYEGAAGKPGIFERYANALASASLPAQVPRLLKVTEVSLAPEVVQGLPAYLKSAPGVAQSWAADMVSEAISTRAGVPLIPYVQGYAVGNVLPMRVSDGTVFNLKLPEPDYAISVHMSGTKKVKFGASGAGESFVYGTYASIKIEQPLMGTVYMNTALKNGETKVVPASQTHVDDFPAFYDSWNGLFTRLATAIDKKEMAWVKASATATDIESQVLQVNNLFQQCK